MPERSNGTGLGGEVCENNFNTNSLGETCWLSAYLGSNPNIRIVKRTKVLFMNSPSDAEKQFLKLPPNETA